MGEVGARYRVGELETRAQYAHVWLDGMGELNRTLQRTIGVSPNIARQIRGFYLEASHFVLRSAESGPTRGGGVRAL